MSRRPQVSRQPLRVIGGRMRGRKIDFPAVDGLRPTPDRIRETLFNWLMPVITDAVCLDAFAGSGMLGIEALSRGAKRVYFVEAMRATAQHLQQQLTTMGVSDRAVIQVGQMPHVDIEGPFDLVFLDPPFQTALWRPCWTWLLANHRLSEDAWVYCESDRPFSPADWPEGWALRRSTRAGIVHATLLQRAS